MRQPRPPTRRLPMEVPGPRMQIWPREGVSKCMPATPSGTTHSTGYAPSLAWGRQPFPLLFPPPPCQVKFVIAYGWVQKITHGILAWSQTYQYCIISCWKPDILISVIGITPKRHLVWGFLLLWLGVGLYLMFSLALSTKVSKFLQHHHFCLCSSLWVSPSTSQKQHLSCKSFNCNPLLPCGSLGVMISELANISLLILLLLWLILTWCQFRPQNESHFLEQAVHFRVFPQKRNGYVWQPSKSWLSTRIYVDILEPMKKGFPTAVSWCGRTPLPHFLVLGYLHSVDILQSSAIFLGVWLTQENSQSFPV